MENVRVTLDGQEGCDMFAGGRSGNQKSADVFETDSGAGEKLLPPAAQKAALGQP